MGRGRRSAGSAACLLLAAAGLADVYAGAGRLTWVAAAGRAPGDAGRGRHGALRQAAAEGPPPLGRQQTSSGQQEEASASPWQLAVSMIGSAAAVVALVLGTPGLVRAESSVPMAAVAPCLLSQCQIPLAKCVLNPNCAANLTCIIACAGQPNEKECQIKCGDNFENDVVTEFNACALTAKKCVPQRPDTGPVPGERNWDPVKGRYPVPSPDAVSQDFDVSKFNGRWYISAGLNPLFDIFPCQVHFFEGFAPTKSEPGKVVGKINWRVSEPDGEFLTKSTVQRFVETSPGVLENHGNEYLHYQDDWYILDHADEDNPDLGFVLIYYRGQNDAWAGYGGGTLYTRARTPPPEIMDRVREATAKAKVPFDKFWKTTDNACEVAGDPVKLRAEYAERLLKQGELSAEEQLTIMARSAYQELGKDENYVVGSAARLEKMTECFLRDEVAGFQKIIGSEKDLEQQELALEAPLTNLLKWFKGAKTK